ncbi:MAG: hypothetical protein ACOZAA_11800, partial [Pseudomonadota bacterium]
VASTGAIGLAREAFRRGYAMDRGAPAGGAFRDALSRLQAVMARYDEIIRRENQTTAMSFLRQVRRDLAIMLNRRRAYAEEDVNQWLDNISTELAQSRNRHAAMLRAARAKADLDTLASDLAAGGISIEPFSKVTTPPGASIGWRFFARRGEGRLRDA